LAASRIAGVDTSSTTLSYLFWELSRRSDILKRLQHELDLAMIEECAIPDITILQSLPYLNAFLKEGYTIPELLTISLLTTSISRPSTIWRRPEPSGARGSCE
jgi:cytochrome P450